ncbi:MAG: hypothetical protein ACYTHK_09910 [Planctomycetota bacterium]|jgi:hypothetical protein
MLWVLHHRRNAHPIEYLLRYGGEEIRTCVKQISYQELADAGELPGGAYLFVDLDILDPDGVAFARRVAHHVRGRAPFLNDPEKFLGRFDLLTRLHEEGINSYRAYREGGPDRWPVFVRGELDHKGPRTGLITHPGTLAAAMEFERGATIFVEFVDTLSPDGYYRKYAACRVDHHVFARHLLFDRDWPVKLNVEPGPEHRAEERAFVESFPDREEVERIFDIAGVEYGRIDYGRGPDGIEVWEINSNPVIVDGPTLRMKGRRAMNEAVLARHVAAMVEFAAKGKGRPAIPLDRPS